MADLTPSIPGEPARMTVERYFGLVETGVLSEDDRVELLEGVIVAMTPKTRLTRPWSPGPRKP